MFGWTALTTMFLMTSMKCSSQTLLKGVTTWGINCKLEEAEDDKREYSLDDQDLPLSLNTFFNKVSGKGSSVNDVTQFWKIKHPLPLSLRFLIIRLYCCHHKPSPHSGRDVMYGRPLTKIKFFFGFSEVLGYLKVTK